MLSQGLQFRFAEALGQFFKIKCVAFLIIAHSLEVRISLFAVLDDLALQILVACERARCVFAPLGKATCLVLSIIRRIKRWSHFLTQPAKVDSPMQRMIHHEDAETVFG